MLCLMLILFTEAHTVSLHSGKANHEEEILLDGKLYRPVEDYGGERKSKIVSVIKWLLSPLLKLWTHHHQEDHHDQNDRPFKLKYPFLSKTQFKPKHGLNSNSNSFQEKLKPYKPRYVFKTKHDHFFSQRVWRKQAL